MTGYDRIVTALEEAGLLREAPAGGRELLGITDDSRQVRPGYLFCAVRGTEHDGHDYVADAQSRGAAAVLVEDAEVAAGPTLLVQDGRRATAVAAAAWFGWPSRKLTLAAVTGTNGKSTTVAVLRHLYNAESDTGWIGTLGAFDGQGGAVFREGLTTPGAVGLQETLAELVARGTRRVVMEASSHALDQHRMAGLTIDAAVFTNLTHDHLDYHGTFAAYLRAKSRLVDYVSDGGCLAVNADDPAWRSLPERAGVERITFSVEGNADVVATDILVEATGTRFRVRFGDSTPVPATIPLVGRFNVSNALGAATAAWGRGRGLPVDMIVERLAQVEQIPGRMERLSDDPLVLRDYAHTPDALERALSALRPLVRKRLIVLFGCGGDRDRRKREPMGRIAVRAADLAIATSDNPRTEDPELILDDVAEGMEGHAYLRITDRREAIERALELLEPGDCLLLAGKGHETYQVLGTERVPFDERAIVQQLLAEPA